MHSECANECRACETSNCMSRRTDNSFFRANEKSQYVQDVVRMSSELEKSVGSTAVSTWVPATFVNLRALLMTRPDGRSWSFEESTYLGTGLGRE